MLDQISRSNMKVKEILNKYLKNPNKIVFSTLFSVLITFLFAIYNLYLGLKYRDSWGISIAVYYICLLIARLSFLIIENKTNKKEDFIKNKIRKKSYIYLSVFMFFIDFCLIAPISLMIVCPKEVSFGLIPAIAVATYTTYKITIAIKNYLKVKRYDNLMYKFVRELSIIDALVSILTLQHTLIMVNGGMNDSMLILSSITSFLIFLTIVIFNIISIIKSIKSFSQ